MSSSDDGGSMVCPLHETRTRISCIRCGRPICPQCAVTSPVGLTCGEHPQRSIRFVRWLPPRGSVRSGYFPTVGVFLLSSLVLAGAARALISLFVALDAARPWVGITLFVVLIAAIMSAFLYWLWRQL